MKNYELGSELFQFPNGARVFEAERKSDKERAMVLCFPRLKGVDTGVYTRADSTVEQLREEYFVRILDVSDTDSEYAFCIAYQWDDEFIPLKEMEYQELWVMRAVAEILESLQLRRLQGNFMGEQAVFVNQKFFSVRLGFVGLMEVFGAHSEEAQPQKPNWRDDVYRLAQCFEIPESCSDVIHNCLAEDEKKRPRYPELLREMGKTCLFRPHYPMEISLYFNPQMHNGKRADELIEHLNLNDCHLSPWEQEGKKELIKCKFDTKKFKGEFIRSFGNEDFSVRWFKDDLYSPSGKILHARFCRVMERVRGCGREDHHLSSEKSKIVNRWKSVPKNEKEYIEETAFKARHSHVREVRESSVRKFAFLISRDVTLQEVNAFKQKGKRLESVPMLGKGHPVDVGLVDDITQSRLVVHARMGKGVKFPQKEEPGVLIGPGVEMPFDFSWQYKERCFFAAGSNLPAEQRKAEIDKIIEGGGANFFVKVKEQDYELEEIFKCEISREIITHDAEEGLGSIFQQGELQENVSSELVPFRRQIDAVDKFNFGDMAEPSLCDILVAPSEHQPRIVPPINREGPLDEAQKRAVNGALFQKPLFLIQGPPGTGKTTVIVEVIHQILKQNPKAHILVCSQTNLAVDNVIERLLDNKKLDNKKNSRRGIRKIRLASLVSQNKVMPDVEKFLYENRLRTWILEVIKISKEQSQKRQNQIRRVHAGRVEMREEGTRKQGKAMRRFAKENIIKQWGAFLGKHSDDDCLIRGNVECGWMHLKEAFLKSMNVIGATCVHIASNEYRKVLCDTYDFLLLDEAAKATSAETMIPVVLAKQIVLIGDHKQLPPFVTNEREVLDKVKEENDELMDERVENLHRIFGVSLFEELLSKIPDECRVMLDMQRRMPKQIGDLISRHFYNGELKTPSDEKYAREKRLSLPFKRETALVYIDTSKRNNPHDNGTPKLRQNLCNAEVIVETLRCLDDKIKEDCPDVAIIAAYCAQVQLLDKEVNRAKRQSPFNRLGPIEIKTVDSFQGRENTIVIYDIVRSSPGKAGVGFLDEPKRLNVALSRAQKLLIIVGDAGYWINRALPGKTRREEGEERPILGEIAEEIRQQGFVVDSLKEILDD